MAIWCRFRPSQVKNLSRQLKGCYSQVHGSSEANQTALQTRILLFDKPSCIIPSRRLEFFNNVRFYAAPVQVKPKQEMDPSGPRLNDHIRADYVRLVTDEGHSVVPRHEALQRARQLKLDLVEVQRNAKPPVCKLMDYHKEKYNQEVKEKDRSKSKSEVTLRKGECKEIRFEAKIEQKDLKTKADTAKRLMERGYRVKCVAKGSEEKDLQGLLTLFSPLIEDVAIVESGPIVDKKQAYVIVRHVKFGPSKKGSVKKLSKVLDTYIDVQKTATQTISSTGTPLQSNENSDSAESGLETDSNILSKDALNISSEFTSSIPVLDSTRIQEVPSSPTMAPPGTDNRYRRDPRNRFAATKPNSPGMRDATQVAHQSLNQEKPRLELNKSPPTRETRYEKDASVFRNLKSPAYEMPKQQNLCPSAPSSPASNYGNFGALNSIDRSAVVNEATGVNRYKKGNSTSSSPRNPTPTGPSASQRLRPPNSSGNGGTYADKIGQGRWGIFSNDSSNVIPTINPENQAKFQR